MGPCPFGDLASVSPDGPLDPGDLQARPFRAEKLTTMRRQAGPGGLACLRIVVGYVVRRLLTGRTITGRTITGRTITGRTINGPDYFKAYLYSRDIGF